MSADPTALSGIGAVVGQQLRITKDSNNFANYTVSDSQTESPTGIIRMNSAGRLKINGSAGNSCTVDAVIANTTMTDAQADAASEFVERLSDNGSATNLIATAPHGGDIEAYTDSMAVEVASQLSSKSVSYWLCKGWKQGGGAFNRWHITSTEISPLSFPLLNSVWTRGWSYAVSFHGYSGSNILIGGTGSSTLKNSLQSGIQTAVSGSGISVQITSSGDPEGGNSSSNYINKLSANGIQIELSLTARSSYWKAIADAVATVYNGLI